LKKFNFDFLGSFEQFIFQHKRGSATRATQEGINRGAHESQNHSIGWDTGDKARHFQDTINKLKMGHDQINRGAQVI